MTAQDTEIKRIENMLLQRHEEVMDLYHRQQRGEGADQPPVKFYGKDNTSTQTLFTLDNAPVIAEVERDLFALDAMHKKLQVILSEQNSKASLSVDKNSTYLSDELRELINSTYQIFLGLTSKPTDEYKTELDLCVKISVLCEKISTELAVNSVTNLLVNQVFQKSLPIQLYHLDNFSNRDFLRQALKFNNEQYRKVRLEFVRNLMSNSPDNVADDLLTLEKSAINKLIEFTEILDAVPESNTPSVQSISTQLAENSKSKTAEVENQQLLSQAEIQSSVNKFTTFIASNPNLNPNDKVNLHKQFNDLLMAMGKHLYQQIKHRPKHKNLKLDSDLFLTFNLAIALDTTYIKYLEKFTNDYYKLYRAYQHLANLYQKYNQFYQKTSSHSEAKHWVLQYSLFIQDRALNLRSIVICDKAVKSHALNSAERRILKEKAHEHLHELSTVKLFEDFCNSDYAINYASSEATNAILSQNELISLHDMHTHVGQSLDIKSATITLDKYYQDVTSYLMQTMSSLFGDELAADYFVLFIESDIKCFEPQAEIDARLSTQLQTILANKAKMQILNNALSLFYTVQIRYYREAILSVLGEDKKREKDFINTQIFTSNLHKEIFSLLLTTTAQQDIRATLQSCVQIINMRMYVNSFIKVLANLKIQELQNQQADITVEIDQDKPSQATLVESVTRQYSLENTVISLPNWHACQREINHLLENEQYADAKQKLAIWLRDALQKYDSAVYSPNLFAAHLQQVYIYKLENDYSKALAILENIDKFVAPRDYGLMNFQHLYIKYVEMATLYKLQNGSANEQSIAYYIKAQNIAQQGGFIPFAALFENYKSANAVDSELVEFLLTIEVENSQVKNFNVSKYDLEYFFKFYQKFADDLFKQILASKSADSANDPSGIALKIYKKLASISRCYPKYVVANLFALAAAYHNLQELNPSTLNLKKALEAYYEVIKYAKKHSKHEFKQQAWQAIGSLKENYGLQYMPNKKKSGDIDDLSPELQEELYQELFSAIVTSLELTADQYNSVLTDVKNLLLALQLIDIYLLYRQLHGLDDSKSQILQAVKNDIYTKIVESYNEYQAKFKDLYSKALKNPNLDSTKALIDWCGFEQMFAVFAINLQNELRDEKDQQLTPLNYKSDSVLALIGSAQKFEKLKTMLKLKKIQLPAELAANPEDISNDYCAFTGLEFNDEFLEKFSSAADSEDHLYQSSIVLLQMQKYWQGIGMAYMAMQDKPDDTLELNMLNYIIAKTFQWAAKGAAKKSFIELFADKSLARDILNLFKLIARQKFQGISKLDLDIMQDIQNSSSQLSFIGVDGYSELMMYKFSTDNCGQMVDYLAFNK